MGKEKQPIEWTISEDEQTWQIVQPQLGVAAATPAESMYSAAPRWENRLAALMVVLAVILLAGWACHQQLRRTDIKGELQEDIVRQTSGEPRGQILQGQPSPVAKQAALAGQQLRSSAHPCCGLSEAAVQVGEMYIQGDRAMARVTVSYSTAAGSLLAYREIRFYQRTTKGWLRIKPDPALIGPWQTIEIPHFRIRYRPIDANAVAEAAPSLELLYDKMHRDFGLPTVDVSAKITVEVATDGRTGGYPPTWAMYKIILPSSALLSVPVNMPASTVLYQSLVYPVAALTLQDAVEPQSEAWQQTVVLRWQPVIKGLRLWEVWEEDGPLAVWRADVVRWLYQNTLASAIRKVVPDNYHQLCRTYRIWKLNPAEMFIPLDCSAQDLSQEPLVSAPQLPTRLNELSSDAYLEQAHKDPTLDSSPRVVAVETLIEYVVATYGRDRLPHLLSALGEHASWQGLIPAVFGVSAAEFEAGWQAYLAEQYGS
jgi:hypothetical protein